MSECRGFEYSSVIYFGIAGIFVDTLVRWGVYEGGVEVFSFFVKRFFIDFVVLDFFLFVGVLKIYRERGRMVNVYI